MYIPIQPILKQYKIIPRGVIHVGANDADEHSIYVSLGVDKMVYIEPCKDAFNALVDKFAGEPNESITLINIACGAEEKELPMHISKQNKGMSNSFLTSKLHSVQHPDILFTDTELIKIVTLDSLPIDKSKFNILVTDCEGYDGEVMKGAKETLRHIDLVYSEINRDYTRENNMLIDEFEELLWGEGFVKVKEFWPSPTLTWGDSVFVKVKKILTSEDLDML